MSDDFELWMSSLTDEVNEAGRAHNVDRLNELTWLALSAVTAGWIIGLDRSGEPALRLFVGAKMRGMAERVLDAHLERLFDLAPDNGDQPTPDPKV